MRIKPLHKNFIMPVKSTQAAGAYDIYMPSGGQCTGAAPELYGLGFAAAVPAGYAAIILPRSGVGAKFGVELNNICGLIDSDYRGEWKAALRTKSGLQFAWDAGERILQFMVIPLAHVELQLVYSLDNTERDSQGFGSSGK